MNLPLYLGLLHSGESTLAETFRQVADGHGDEPDVYHLCHTLASQCDEHVQRLQPVIERYGEQRDGEPEAFHAEAMTTSRTGPVGLLRDLQDVYVHVSLVSITWTIVEQAGKALRDDELLGIITACSAETAVQQSWLTTRIKQAAPQALLVAS